MGATSCPIRYTAQRKKNTIKYTEQATYTSPHLISFAILSISRSLCSLIVILQYVLHMRAQFPAFFEREARGSGGVSDLCIRQVENHRQTREMNGTGVEKRGDRIKREEIDRWSEGGREERNEAHQESGTAAGFSWTRQEGPTSRAGTGRRARRCGLHDRWKATTPYNVVREASWKDLRSLGIDVNSIFGSKSKEYNEPHDASKGGPTR